MLRGEHHESSMLSEVSAKDSTSKCDIRVKIMNLFFFFFFFLLFCF